MNRSIIQRQIIYILLSVVSVLPILYTWLIIEYGLTIGEAWSNAVGNGYGGALFTDTVWLNFILPIVSVIELGAIIYFPIKGAWNYVYPVIALIFNIILSIIYYFITIY